MIKLYKKFSSISPRAWLIILLAASFLFRFLRLSTPSSYVFDEVYHVVTARGYSKGLKDAYNPFSSPPEPNTAYDWLHPPIAKLVQAGSIKLIGDNSLAWRLPSAIFGTLSIAALYFFSLTLFKSEKLALLAATIFSLDGMQLTMSRITMNDIFVTTFIIFALTFFHKVIGSATLRASSEPSKSFKKHLFLTGLFTGLALATKWSAIFLFPIFSLFSIKKIIKKPIALLYFFSFLIALPLTIYLLSYTQYFILGYSFKDFIGLHQQIYWYQTGLTATHDYQSTAWQWPLLIRPVWFHVQYLVNKVAHIYNLGNPVIFWGGIIAIVSLVVNWIRSVLEAKLQGRTLMDSLKNIFKYFFNHLNEPFSFLLVSYLMLFLPWLFSPRILFLHHYLPALPFLCLIIASVIYKNKSLTKLFLLLSLIFFLFFYPLNTAIPLPSRFINFWRWFPSWR